MKFTDGYWKIRSGITPYHPAEAYEIETGPRGFTVYAPTQRVRHRGDTLNGTLLTLIPHARCHPGEDDPLDGKTGPATGVWHRGGGDNP